MIGIYLMYNGDCYPNGSYLRDIAINIPAVSWFPNFDYLQCVLPDSTLSGGVWFRSNGESVDCTNIILTVIHFVVLPLIHLLILLYVNLMDKSYQHLRIDYTSAVYTH